MSKIPGEDATPAAYDSKAYWAETAGYDYGDIKASIEALD